MARISAQPKLAVVIPFDLMAFVIAQNTIEAFRKGAVLGIQQVSVVIINKPGTVDMHPPLVSATVRVTAASGFALSLGYRHDMASPKNKSDAKSNIHGRVDGEREA